MTVLTQHYVMKLTEHLLKNNTRLWRNESKISNKVVINTSDQHNFN